MTLPSSETITIQLTVSSIISLPCWPDRVIVSRQRGTILVSPTQEANPGTKPGADEYCSLAKPLAAALPCKHKASLYLPSCEGAVWAPSRRSSRVPLSTAALPGLFLLCSGARICNIFTEISFNSCSGSSRRSWLNTHFRLNVGPK